MKKHHNWLVPKQQLKLQHSYFEKDNFKSNKLKVRPHAQVGTMLSVDRAIEPWSIDIQRIIIHM